MEVSGKPHAQATLPPGKEPRCSWNGRLGGLHSRAGRFGDEINFLPVPGFEPRSLPPVAWSLYRLSYRGSQKKVAGFVFDAGWWVIKISGYCIKRCWCSCILKICATVQILMADYVSWSASILTEIFSRLIHKVLEGANSFCHHTTVTFCMWQWFIHYCNIVLATVWGTFDIQKASVKCWVMIEILLIW
jgi:hypothetical protein